MEGKDLESHMITTLATLVVQNGRVTVTAPILRYMAGWTVTVVRAGAGGGQIPSEQLFAASAPSQR